jgi:hypothetical protein
MKADDIGKLWDENKRVIDFCSTDELDDLHETHQNLFDKAMDSDIPKKEIATMMNKANERFYYENNLDIGEDFINRKALDDYDPQLASKLLFTQIEVLEKLILERLRPQQQQKK